MKNIMRAGGPGGGQRRGRDWPAGAAVTLAGLSRDPYPLLARLRAREPVSWLPALNGWLVTSRDLAIAVLRDDAAFAVDDPRFTTAQVVGHSMLSRDGGEHMRHRSPFAPGFSRAAVAERLAAFTGAEAERLLLALRPAGRGDLRAGLAGPLAVAVIAEALGLGAVDPGVILAWYRDIVAGVSALAGLPGQAPGSQQAGAAAAAAFGQLAARLRQALAAPAGASLLAGAAAGGLAPGEAVSNAAVLMFGGIETTEGMISNALLHLLTHPDQLRLVRDDPGLVPAAVEESLRLEPAAALVDRYATRDTGLGGARIRAGDLVSVSIAGAGRDPAVFPRPDTYDVRRPNSRQHLAFARGPHFCLGVHLARLEAECAVRAALRLLPGLRLAGPPPAPEGLVFRKPPSLPARWDPAG